MRFLLSLLGPQWRLWLIVAGLSLAVVVMVQVYGGIYDKGAQDAKQEQKEVDDETANKAWESRNTWRRCFDAGGMWDFDKSECSPPERSGGD